MSVVSVKEINDGRGGGDEISKDGAKSTDVIRHRVITTSPFDGTATVLQATDNLGVVHPTLNWLYVKSRRAKPEDKSKLVWVTSHMYASLGVGSLGYAPNPLSQPAKITWTMESTQENAYFDNEDNSILNSAGDYYIDGVPVDSARWVANVTKNLAITPFWLNDYRDAINSDTFYLDGVGIFPFAAKLSGVSIGEWLIMNDIWYRQVQMTIKIKNSWRFFVQDAGLRRIVATGEGDRREKCLNEDGSAVDSPVLLDGSGAQLVDPTFSNAVYNQHNIYPELPFGVLPIY